MRYSDELIEEVRSRNDIVDVIGGNVRLRRAGSNYVGLCPFHNEKTASFTVNRPKQMYYCFGCHAGGNVITFIMEYNNMNFVEALQFLADRAGVTLPKIEYSGEARELSERKDVLYDIHKKAATYYYYALRREDGGHALGYLKNRGLSDETIRKFGLGYAGRDGGLYNYLKSKDFSDEMLKDSGLFVFDEKRGVLDKFWNRVIFPIQDVRGKVIGFGGRVMGDAKPKYLNSPDTELFNKRKHLFGLNIARSTRRKYIILCEGYMDVISMHQAGFDNTVASLGTALTPQQANLLRRYTDNVFLLYDSDNAGKTAAIRAIPILKDEGLSVRVVNQDPYKDPDEFIKALGAEEMEKRLDEARDAILFEIAEVSKNYRMEEPQERTRFIYDVSGRLLNIPDEVERENYIEAVAREYYIKPDTLRKSMNRLALSGNVPDRRQAATDTGDFVRKRKDTAEDGIVRSEKLMLTYLANHPEAYALTKDYLGPADFSDPLCRTIAENLYTQFEEGQVNEAALINLFSEAEDQNMVAELFHTTIATRNSEDQDKAFTDTVVRIMNASNDRRIKSWDGKDVATLNELIGRKKKLEEFRSGGKIFRLTYPEDDTPV